MKDSCHYNINKTEINYDKFRNEKDQTAPDKGKGKKKREK